MLNKRIIVTIALFNVFLGIKCEVGVEYADPVKLNGFSISDYITSCGYPFELHKNVQTEDGYLLDMHRIPHGKNTENATNRKSILLMHGLLGSSENWVVLGCGKGLAFILADNGYDVWMGNARGSAHSRKHVTLDPDKDTEFWNFSWHEIGVHDIPTQIDYVRNSTDQEKIYYIGHSQGTTAYFVMASEKPDYNNYIHVMIALAPVAYMSSANDHGEHHRGSFIGHFIQNGMQKLIDDIGMEEIRPAKNKTLCIELGRFNGFCSSILDIINRNPKNMEPDVQKRCEQTFPAGAAVRQFIHYAQEYISGKFCQYDHGHDLNLKMYGSTDPPPYNIYNISSPVGIFYSEKDMLAPAQNVERLQKELPRVIVNYVIPSPTFSHFDFLISADAVNLLYLKILEVISVNLNV